MSPRTKKQFEEIREASQEKIIRAALELFGTKGYDATSITEIAEKAGISKGLLYHYFDSKETLLASMLAQINSYETAFMARVQDPDPRKFIRNIIEWFFNEMRDNYQWWKLVTNLTIQIERFDFVHNLATEKFNGFLTLFEDVFKKLDVPDPRKEALLLTALFDGIGIQYHVINKDYPLEEIENVLIEKYCEP